MDKKAPLLVQADYYRRYFIFLDEQGNLSGHFWDPAAKTWTPEKIILEGPVLNFTAAIDGQNRLFLVYRQSPSELSMVTLAGTRQLGRNFVLPMSSSTDYDCFVDNIGTLYLVTYDLDQPGKVFIRGFHQNGTRQKPVPACFDTDNNLQYATGYMDKDDFLHLVYQTFDGSSYHLLHRIYRTNEQTWTVLYPFYKSQQKSRQHSLLLDQQGNLHLIFVAGEEEQGTIVFMRKTRGGWPKDGWETGVTLSNPDSPAQFPSLILHGDDLAALWVQDEAIYGCFSQDSGKNWSPCRQLAPLKDLSTFRVNTGLDAGSFVCNTWAIAQEFPPDTLFQPSAIIQLGLNFARRPETDSAVVNGQVDEQSETAGADYYLQQLNSYLQKLIAQIEDLKQSKKILESSLDKKQKEMLTLSHQAGSLQDKLQSLAKELRESSQELQRYKEQVKKLQLENEKLLEKNLTLLQRLDSKNRECAELEKLAQDLRSKNRQLEKALAEKSLSILQKISKTLQSLLG